MYCVIFIRGGRLIMMGQHARSESLFYYFKLDLYLPKSHLLRLIDEHVSFAFVRQRSSWRRLPRTSNDWSGSSPKRQTRLFLQCLSNRPPTKQEP
jgi:hypothetical protein